MIPLHTQETLNSLTWDEVRNLHASLGLVATAKSRTRRDYENRILQVQPQKVEEPLAKPSERIAQPSEPIAPQVGSQVGEENEPPNRGDNGRGRLQPLPKIWDKVTSDVAIGDYIKMPFHPVSMVADKEQMSDGRTRLLVRPLTGSHSEEWYLPAPEPVQQPVWSLDQIEEAIAKLKADILDPTKLLDRPVCVAGTDIETIDWKTPFEGEILGRGEKRSFFIENDCVYLVLGAFCASERKHKNYHHTVIRQAIEAGKTFDISSPMGERCRFGRIHQSCDGWWWVWGDLQSTGHKFLTRLTALKHLELRNMELGDRVASASGGMK